MCVLAVGVLALVAAGCGSSSHHAQQPPTAELLPNPPVPSQDPGRRRKILERRLRIEQARMERLINAATAESNAELKKLDAQLERACSKASSCAQPWP
jgi:hypothetical protein